MFRTDLLAGIATSASHWQKEAGESVQPKVSDVKSNSEVRNASVMSLLLIIQNSQHRFLG